MTASSYLRLRDIKPTARNLVEIDRILMAAALPLNPPEAEPGDQWVMIGVVAAPDSQIATVDEGRGIRIVGSSEEQVVGGERASGPFFEWRGRIWEMLPKVS
jgi:hypothetical protein